MRNTLAFPHRYAKGGLGDWKQRIQGAETVIRPYIRETPVERCRWLEDDVWLKLENFQVTGSFKARGAMHKLLCLGDERRAKGVISASSGNHGAAVAWGAGGLDCQALVCVPEVASPAKIAAIRGYGAEVRVHGHDCVVAEAYARKKALDEQRTYVSPYNDPEVVLGQGTIGVELERQLGEFDAVFIALGGGGLIAGVGLYLKKALPNVEIVACSPDQSPAMHACLEAGRILDVPCHATLSDATAGGVEAGAITFDLCRQVVDQSILVTEAEIAEAMRQVLTSHHMLVEGAAGVAVAAYHKVAHRYRGKRVAIVVCGANIGMEKLKGVLA